MVGCDIGTPTAYELIHIRISPNRASEKVMSEEPAEVRRIRGQNLFDLVREDLDIYGVSELEERIADLTAEIERSQQAIARKKASQAAADLFFKKD
jgi:uncharacterized small protein (DUF1192 family)